MTIIRKIKYGNAVDANDMQNVLGGQESNMNEADYCSCSAATNQSIFCSDNVNKKKYCSC